MAAHLRGTGPFPARPVALDRPAARKKVHFRATRGSTARPGHGPERDGSTVNQAVSMGCLVRGDVSGPAAAQLPRGGEPVREGQLSGQGPFDELPDLLLCVRLG